MDAIEQIAISALVELAPLMKDRLLVGPDLGSIERVVRAPGRFQQVAKRTSRRFDQAETEARLAGARTARAMAPLKVASVVSAILCLMLRMIDLELDEQS